MLKWLFGRSAGARATRLVALAGLLLAEDIGLLPGELADRLQAAVRFSAL